MSNFSQQRRNSFPKTSVVKKIQKPYTFPIFANYVIFLVFFKGAQKTRKLLLWIFSFKAGASFIKPRLQNPGTRVASKQHKIRGKSCQRFWLCFLSKFWLQGFVDSPEGSGQGSPLSYGLPNPHSSSSFPQSNSLKLFMTKWIWKQTTKKHELKMKKKLFPTSCQYGWLVTPICCRSVIWECLNKFEQGWKKLDVNYVVDKPNGPCPIVSKLHGTFTSKLEQNVDPIQFFW